MKDITEEFTTRGIMRSNLLLLTPPVAAEFIRECKERNISLLGIDGFRLVGDETQPIMNDSIDLSSAVFAGLSDREKLIEAIKFLQPRMSRSDLLFEMTI